jgi:hypothetical protein
LFIALNDSGDVTRNLCGLYLPYMFPVRSLKVLFFIEMCKGFWDFYEGVGVLNEDKGRSLRPTGDLRVRKECLGI